MTSIMNFIKELNQSNPSSSSTRHSTDLNKTNYNRKESNMKNNIMEIKKIVSFIAVFAILFGVLTGCAEAQTHEEWLRATNQLNDQPSVQEVVPAAGTINNSTTKSYDTLGGETFDYKAGYETLLATKDSLTTDLANAASQINTLQGNLQEATNQLQAASNQLKEASSQLSETTAELQTTKGEVVTLKGQLTEAEEAVIEAQVEMTKSATKATESENKLATEGQINVELRHENGELQQKLDEAIAELETYKQSCAANSETMKAELIEEYEAIIADLRLQVMTEKQKLVNEIFTAAYEFGTSLGYTVNEWNYSNFAPLHMSYDGKYEVGGIWALYNMRIEHPVDGKILVSYKAAYNLEDVHVNWVYDMNDVHFGGDNDLLIALKNASIIAELSTGERFQMSIYSASKTAGTLYIQSGTTVLGYEEIWAKKVGDIGWLASVIGNAIGRDTTTGELKLKIGYGTPETDKQQTVQDPDIHMPGRTIQDPDIHLPGRTIQDPDTHLPGRTIQDPDVHLPGQTIQDPDVHLPGQTIQDPDIHVPGQIIEDPPADYNPPVTSDPDDFTEPDDGNNYDYNPQVTSDPDDFTDDALTDPLQPSGPSYTDNPLEPSGPSYTFDYNGNITSGEDEFEDDSIYSATVPSYYETGEGTYTATTSSTTVTISSDETYTASVASGSSTSVSTTNDDTYTATSASTTTTGSDTYSATGNGNSGEVYEASAPSYYEYNDTIVSDVDDFGD